MENKIVLTKEFLDSLLKDLSIQTAGKICSVVETVLGDKSKDAELLKKLLKNLNYQQFREISYRVDAYIAGFDSIKITKKPTSK